MRTLMIVLGLLLCSCDQNAPEMDAPKPVPPQVPKEPQSVVDAKLRYPNLFRLQTGHIEKTCSPNPGVCHNSNNYPEFRTVGNLIAAISAPCNIEMPDVTQGWDACERPADVLIVDGERYPIAWTKKLGGGRWTLALAKTPTENLTTRFSIESAQKDTLLSAPEDWNVVVRLKIDDPKAEITAAPNDGFLLRYIDEVLATVLGGDFNQNGILGADERSIESARLIWPGSPERSYLWRRLLGDVPGSPMPLANEPLGNAEFVAIACWIESLQADQTPSVMDPIDYENCKYAAAPLDPASN